MDKLTLKERQLALVIGPMNHVSKIFKHLDELFTEYPEDCTIVTVNNVDQSTGDFVSRLKDRAMKLNQRVLVIIGQKKEFTKYEDLENTIEPLQYADYVFNYRPTAPKKFKLIGGR